MLYREVTVGSQIDTKCKNALYWQNIEFFSVTHGATLQQCISYLQTSRMMSASSWCTEACDLVMRKVLCNVTTEFEFVVTLGLITLLKMQMTSA